MSCHICAVSAGVLEAIPYPLPLQAKPYPQPCSYIPNLSTTSICEPIVSRLQNKLGLPPAIFNSEQRIWWHCIYCGTNQGHCYIQATGKLETHKCTEHNQARSVLVSFELFKTHPGACSTPALSGYHAVLLLIHLLLPLDILGSGWPPEVSDLTGAAEEIELSPAAANKQQLPCHSFEMIVSGLILSCQND